MVETGRSSSRNIYVLPSSSRPPAPATAKKQHNEREKDRRADDQVDLVSPLDLVVQFGLGHAVWYRRRSSSTGQRTAPVSTRRGPCALFLLFRWPIFTARGIGGTLDLVLTVDVIPSCVGHIHRLREPRQRPYIVSGRTSAPGGGIVVRNGSSVRCALGLQRRPRGLVRAAGRTGNRSCLLLFLVTLRGVCKSQVLAQ